MRKSAYLLFSIVACVILSSCESTYTFYQIYEAEPIDKSTITATDNGCLKFENDQCVIIYDFWARRGSADMCIANKTNEIIYVDLTKSFFVRNGMAYDLFLDREWSSTSSTEVVRTSTSTYSYLSSRGFYTGFSASANVDNAPGRIYSGLGDGKVGTVSVSAGKSAGKTYGSSVSSSTAVATSHSKSETTKEKSIIAIPPHSVKVVQTPSIVQKAYYSCNLQSYPSTSAQVTFTPENTPIQFANYITYIVGESKNVTSVENKFYVSSITNYAEPEAVEYEKRDTTCENLPWLPEYEYQTAGGAPLYDRYIKAGPGRTFYCRYEIETYERLYKRGARYSYNPTYDAYVRAFK